MMKYRLALLTPLILLVIGESAQVWGSNRYGNLSVRITFADGRAANVRPLVQLMSGASNNPVAQDFADEEGMVTFPHLELGMYHIRVTGQGIEDADSGMFEVDDRKATQFVFITVRRVGESRPGAAAAGPLVAAPDLKIPAKARKEFDKAGDLLNQKEWQKAIERLKRALDVYPSYAAAYNNLAVAYGQVGDRLHEREALQHAISIDDHFAAAFVNLAKMDIQERNLPEAETLLSKATAADPANPETLMLLANIELVQKQYQDAILHCQKVHAMAHEHYAVVHYIAARAFEQMRQLREAAAELQTFLQEEPSGPRAEGARKELANVEQHLAQ